VCDALDKAGVVLRIKNLVYLRPLEVAEVLYQVSFAPPRSLPLLHVGVPVGGGLYGRCGSA